VGAASILQGLREEVHRTVAEVIAPGARCALLGYPNHTNPGDHAVWLGARATLQHRQAEIVYECSWRDYSRDALRSAVEQGAQIVFTGGGNFGDLWPATHVLRERVLEDFKGTRVVQLQQSVHFERADNLARTADLLRRHGNVALVVRDRPSLELAQRSFDVDVRLAPDLGFAAPLPAPAEKPTVAVAWIAREDRESRGLNPEVAPKGVWRIDWNLREHEQRRLRAEPPLPAALGDLIARNKTLTKTDRDWRILSAIRDQLSDMRLKRGCRILGRGRVIVTDSLHAHILGLMLGIPTVATDNSYGKLKATFEAFTHAFPLARWADTPSQALAIATNWAATS
jgi:exopolysaccharide biosynthesis predicted pyruvyltransferase EpsI